MNISSANIIWAFLAKTLNGITGFILLIITANYFGSYGRGMLSVFIANLALVQLVTNIINGPSLTYITVKLGKDAINILVILWSIGMGVLCPFLLSFYFDSNQINIYFYFTSVGFSLYQGQSRILAAIGYYNLSNIVHAFYSIVLCGLSIGLLLIKQTINSQFLAFATVGYLAFLLALSLTIFKDGFTVRRINIQHFYLFLKNGIFTQVSNYADIITCRGGLYLLYFTNENYQSIGYYSVALMLMEFLWLIPNALTSFLLPLLTKYKHNNDALLIAMRFLKFSVLLVTIACLILIALPNSFYLLILGNDFNQIKSLMYLIAIGVIAGTFTKILWNYFTAIGLIKINNTLLISGAMIGLLTSLLFFLYFDLSLNGIIIGYIIGHIITGGSLLLYSVFYLQNNYLQILKEDLYYFVVLFKLKTK